MKFNIFGNLKRKEGQENSIKNKYIEAGKIIKERREEYGITRVQLAKETRITPYVIEAIENGWIERIPEKAYLVRMVSLIQTRLHISTDKLKDLIEDKEESIEKSRSKNNSLRILSLGIFTTWIGNFLYFMIILSSLYGLNIQQNKLIKLNSKSYSPLDINGDQILKNETKINSQDLELSTNRRSILQYLNFNVYKRLQYLTLYRNLSLLEINLSKKSEVRIKSFKKVETVIRNVKGRLPIMLVPPIEVKITPKVSIKDKIIWHGNEEIDSIKTDKGISIYRINK